MDFSYSPEDEAFRAEARKWLEANKKFAPRPAVFSPKRATINGTPASSGTRSSTKEGG